MKVRKKLRMKKIAFPCLLLYVVLSSLVVVGAQAVTTVSSDSGPVTTVPGVSSPATTVPGASGLGSVHPTSTPEHPAGPPTEIHESNLIFLAIIPAIVVLLGVICGSIQCCGVAQRRWKRTASWSVANRVSFDVVDVVSGEVVEGGRNANAQNFTQDAEQPQANPRCLVLPTSPPHVVSELVTPLLSSDGEHGLGGAEEVELQQLSARQSRPYETVMQHAWTDSPPSPTADNNPVTVFNLTAKNRAEQPVAQAPPAPLKPCMVQKGTPSGRSSISSVSYIVPGSSRSGSDVSSNRSQTVSSHSCESLDHRKAVSVSGRPKRQVRIVAPNDVQGSGIGQVLDNGIKESYDDVLSSGDDVRAFDDVIDKEDGYDIVTKGSVDTKDGNRAARKQSSKTVSKDNSEFPFLHPPESEARICERLRKNGYRTISRDEIHISRLLGEGYFGTVCEGTWRLPMRDVKVAVKKANEDLEEKEKVKFLQEAAVIGQFNHPHIVKLYGVIMEDDATGESCAIVLEFLPHGDLKQHLKQMKKQVTKGNCREISRKLLQFCRQVASGMEYLSRKKFVHRDLAARNILLDSNYICKIGDFGLSRDLEEDVYYRTGGGVIAWKWTAPEALKYGKFSTSSDVWSFGCVLYEMWSLGKTPMANVETSELVYMLHRAYRMPPPPGCPRGMYKLMIECWHPERSKRPSFAEVYSSLMQSEDSLLQPSTFDHSHLGSDELTESSEMYMDLQQLYYNHVM